MTHDNALAITCSAIIVLFAVAVSCLLGGFAVSEGEGEEGMNREEDAGVAEIWPHDCFCGVCDCDCPVSEEGDVCGECEVDCYKE